MESFLNSDIWNSVLANLKNDKKRQSELKDFKIQVKDKTLKFKEQTFGEAGPGGYMLFICLHGGGGATQELNDSQWNDIIPFEKKAFKNGTIAVAPRGMTNSWKLHWEDETFPAITRLVENYIILKNVNPNKVYLMGFSAGGDGTYALSERIPFLFAACSPQAGHPNGVSTINISNLPMYCAVGELDKAYDRNTLAPTYYKQIIAQNGKYCGNYIAKCEVVGNSPHSFQCWRLPRKSYFNGASVISQSNETAFTFMYSYTRQPIPTKLSIDVKTWLTPLRNYFSKRGNTFYNIEVGENPPDMIQLLIDYSKSTVKIVEGTNFKINFISDNFRGGSGDKNITIIESDGKKKNVKLHKDKNYIKQNMELYCDPYYGFDSYVIIGNMGKSTEKPVANISKRVRPVTAAPIVNPTNTNIVRPTAAKKVTAAGRSRIVSSKRPTSSVTWPMQKDIGSILSMRGTVKFPNSSSFGPVSGSVGQYLLPSNKGDLCSCFKLSDIQFAWTDNSQYWEKKSYPGALLAKNVYYLKNVFYLDPKGTFKNIKSNDYHLILRHNPKENRGLRNVPVKVEIDGKEVFKNNSFFSKNYNEVKPNQLCDQYITKIEKKMFGNGVSHQIDVSFFSEGTKKEKWAVDGFILIPANESLNKNNYSQYFDAPFIL